MKGDRSIDRFGVRRWSSLVGREEEMTTLAKAIDEAIRGNGNTVMIEGEAGIGKSRLISEIRAAAEEKGVRMLMGRGLEGASPYMPFINAFRDIGPDLITPGELTTIEEVFLLNEKGLLIDHAARTLRPEVDERVFGRVFATIKDFMSRSFESKGDEASLDELQYGTFKILFDSDHPFYLAVVVSGDVSDDLKREMRNLVRNLSNEFGETLKEWTPGEKVPRNLELELARFASREFRAERRLEGLDPNRERNRMFDSVLGLMLAISRVRPVILVLDDMQWLDDTSLDLLHYIARNIRDSRVLVVGAYRPEEGIDPGTRMHVHLMDTLVMMNRERLYTNIKLERLTKEQTIQMLGSIFPKNDFPSSFQDRIFDETEGNPFFVEEIIEALMTDGAIHEEMDVWRVKEDMVVSLPSTIRDVVLRRMDRLDEGYKKILDTAAVMGVEFDIDILRKVMDLDEEDLLVALDELADMKIIKEIPGGEFYAFDHVVIQEVIYEEMSRNLRRMTHRKVAEVLLRAFNVDPDSVVYDLAKHYARTRNNQLAFYYLIRAARKASRHYALKEAKGYYMSALEHMSKLKKLDNRTAIEVRVLNDLAQLCYHLGDWDEAQDLTVKVLEQAPKEGLYTDMAKAYRLRGVMAETRSDWEEAILDLEAAIEISDRVDDPVGTLEAIHMLGKLHWKAANYDKSLEYLNRCIRNCEKQGEGRLLVQALITKGNVYNVKGEFEEAIKLYERGLNMAKGSRQTFEVMRAYNNLGDLFMDRGDLDTAEGHFNRCRETAERVGDQRFIGYSLSNLGECALMREDIDKAKAYCTQALEIFTALDEKSMIAATYIDFGALHGLETNWAEAAVCFDIAIEALKSLGQPHLLARAHTEYADTLKEKGDRISAISHLENALDIYRTSGSKILIKDVERSLRKLRRGEDDKRIVLVGRDKVIADLKGFLERAVAGPTDTDTGGPRKGSFVLLEGEQGMGKSQVQEEVLSYSRGSGITTIVGKCLATEMAGPYYPFTQALFELFTGKDPDSLKRFMRKVPFEILAMLPGIDKVGETGDTETDAKAYAASKIESLELEEGRTSDLGDMKARLFEILSRLLLEIDEPVALFIEDIHHADVSSLQLLGHMAKEMEGSRTFILSSYSPDAIVPMNNFREHLKDIQEEEVTENVRLEPLDQADVKALVSRFLEMPEVPDELARKIHKRTKGNPMFIEEILKVLPRGVDTDELARLDLERLHVPGTILELIARQMTGTSPEAREMLEYAAVAGSGFVSELLFEALGMGEDASLAKGPADVLERLLEKRHLRELDDRTLVFTHPMVQQVVLESIPAKKLKGMHNAFARALVRMNPNDLDAVTFDLAYHFCRAGPSDKCFRHSILSGHKAEAMSAPKEAEGYFRNAIRCASSLRARLGEDSTISPGEVLSARHHLNRALMAQGKLDEAMEVSRISLSLARDAKNEAREAQAMMDIGEIASIKSSWEEAWSCFDRARHLCDEVGFKRGLFRAYKGLSWIGWRQGKFEDAFVHARKCIGLGEELGDRHLVAQGYTELGSAFGERGDFEEAIENLSKARAIFEVAGDSYLLSRVHNNLGVSYRDKGDPTEAIVHFEKSVNISTTIGGIRMMAYAMSNLSECHMMTGDLTKALDTCNRSLSVFIKLDEPYMVSSAYRRLGMIERLRKDLEASEAHFQKSIAVMKDLETPLHTAETQIELGILYRDKGEFDKARECLEIASRIFTDVKVRRGGERVKLVLEEIAELEGRDKDP